MYKLIAQQLDYLTEDEAYEHIAKGIVIQAIEDYRNTLRGKSINKHVNVMKDMKELERFFRSEWFTYLCDWDGETLMKIIKEQEEKDERTAKRNSGEDLPHRNLS